jgi:hypothetical protein
LDRGERGGHARVVFLDLPVVFGEQALRIGRR